MHPDALSPFSSTTASVRPNPPPVQRPNRAVRPKPPIIPSSRSIAPLSSHRSTPIGSLGAIAEVDIMEEMKEKRSYNGSLQTKTTDRGVEYRTTNAPCWRVALLLAFQQTMVCVSGMLVLPYIVSDLACAGSATIELRARLIASTLIATGITTLIQTTLGLRLAILQGPSFAFVPPLLAFGHLPAMECKATLNDYVADEDWMSRIQMIVGSLAAASLVLMLIGATGLVGIIAKRVGPLTICPLMILLCFGNAPLVVEKAGLHWISIVQFLILLLFVVFLAEIDIPLPYYNAGIRFTRYRIFGLFPYLLSIIITWGFALLLTVTNLEPKGGAARVDGNQSMEVLSSSPWFQIPYPGQFGVPRFHLGLFIGMLTSCIACCAESLGGYASLARVSDEKPPPSRTLNRAILVEGLGCFLSAMMGCGVGVTTYSENIAVVAITKVASRFVLQIAALMLIVLGVFTKFAAVMATIPDPMVGGVLAMSVCLVCSVSFSNLAPVDLKISRNLSILGLGVVLGIVIPDYVEKHPIDVGVHAISEMLNVLLTTQMFVGGFISFILDNVADGATAAERGLRPQVFTDEDGKYDGCGTDVDGYSFSQRANRFLLRIPQIHILQIVPSKARLEAALSQQEKQSRSSTATETSTETSGSSQPSMHI